MRGILRKTIASVAAVAALLAPSVVEASPRDRLDATVAWLEPDRAHGRAEAHRAFVLLQRSEPKNTPPAKRVSRRFGLGARVGGFTLGLGVGFRYWSGERLGFQMDVSRYSVGVSGFGVRADSATMQLAPTLLYSVGRPNPDAKIEVRPYVGGGFNLYRTSQSYSETISGLGLRESASDTQAGFHALGGVQVVFKELPRLGLSGDVGYYSTGTPFAGVQVGGLGASLAVHWFVK